MTVTQENYQRRARCAICRQELPQRVSRFSDFCDNCVQAEKYRNPKATKTRNWE